VAQQEKYDRGYGRKLTDSTGAVRYRGEFDPHGQVALEAAYGGTGTYANSHKYTGYEREWNTNLDYAQARMFSHNRARFMQPDPLGLGAADMTAPQTLNQYSYVQNDPVNFVDPSGLLAIFCTPDTMTCDPNTGVCTICAGECHLVGGGGGAGGGLTFGGGGLTGGGIDPQTGGGGGGTGIPPTSIGDIINTAKKALEDPNSPCAKLFKDGNGLKKLEQLEKDKKIKVDGGKVPWPDGTRKDAKNYPSLYAWTTLDSKITINKHSSAYTGVGGSAGFYAPTRTAPAQGRTPAQYLAAVLIHEVLHVTGDFAPEKGPNWINDSLGNQADVLSSCFPKS